MQLDLTHSGIHRVDEQLTEVVDNNIYSIYVPRDGLSLVVRENLLNRESLRFWLKLCIEKVPVIILDIFLASLNQIREKIL